MIVAETERLILRYFHAFDGEAMDRVFGDVEVMRFGDGIQSREWIRDWLRECQETYVRLGFGPWAVASKAQRKVIGYCGLFHFPNIDGKSEIEIGYRLARSSCGQGYATEVVTTVRDYGFNILGLPRLVALIDPQNIASLRVAEKLGCIMKKT